MDYEKKYEEAVERLRNAFYGNNSRMCDEYRKAVISIIEPIFPELKESEDEIMKGKLLEIIRLCYEGNRCSICTSDYKKLLAWLKKQDKLPHWKKGVLPNDTVTGFNSDYFSYNGYYVNYKELFNKLPKDNFNFEKQGEQKPADKKYTFNAIPRLLSMIQPTDRAKVYCQKLIDILIQEGYGADAKVVGNCLKQMNGEKAAMATMNEQNPAWSEEDEKMLNSTIEYLNEFREVYQKGAQECIAWLKSFKERMKGDEEMTQEQMLDKYIGKKGTSERNDYDTKPRKLIDDYHIGEAINTDRKPVSILRDENGVPQGILIQTLDERFALELRHIDHGKEYEWQDAMDRLKELGKTTFNIKQGRLIAAYHEEIDKALEEAGGDKLGWEWAVGECSGDGAWSYDPTYGALELSHKCSSFYVRLLLLEKQI